MNLNELYPSRWLKAADVVKPILATIQSVGIEEVGDEEQKPVVTFAGNIKPMVLNRTNALTIAGLYGENTDHWIGKPIALFSTKVGFQGKLTDAIRVREPRQNHAAPKAPAAAAVPASTAQPAGNEDDVPF